jgi:hypothetical protein
MRIRGQTQTGVHFMHTVQRTHKKVKVKVLSVVTDWKTGLRFAAEIEFFSSQSCHNSLSRGKMINHVREAEVEAPQLLSQ